uniref:Uncharacterized protein n=1 Tax=Octopus bimaculoides TaxID=37653 RepID=A0A0L8H864_OCTBM
MLLLPYWSILVIIFPQLIITEARVWNVILCFREKYNSVRISLDKVKYVNITSKEEQKCFMTEFELDNATKPSFAESDKGCPMDDDHHGLLVSPQQVLPGDDCTLAELQDLHETTCYPGLPSAQKTSHLAMVDIHYKLHLQDKVTRTTMDDGKNFVKAFMQFGTETESFPNTPETATDLDKEGVEDEDLDMDPKVGQTHSTEAADSILKEVSGPGTLPMTLLPSKTC